MARSMASYLQSEPLLDTGAQTVTTSSTTLQEDIDIQEDKSPTNHPGVNGLRRWCYLFHAFLCLLHLALLAMLWHHPEHAFTIPSDNSAFTTGLSASLQAFYTLYTALLVFMTQRLVLSASLSRRQKLTTIHDVSAAWGGLGAALLTLWQQTKIAASVPATLSVFLYLICISGLHVASPTIMQFEPYNASIATTVASNSTWPDPSVNLTALEWDVIAPIVPLMFSFGSSTLSTSGLVNSMLYNTFSGNQAIVNATVNASTIRANCGLLPVLASNNESTIRLFNASLSAVDNVTVEVDPLWKDEILFLDDESYDTTTGTYLDHPLLFVVSAAVQLNSSMNISVSVNTTWNFTPADGTAQNSSTIIYPIACSLYTLSQELIFDVQQDILWSSTDNSNGSAQEWSLWSPYSVDNTTDSENLNAGVCYNLLLCFTNIVTTTNLTQILSAMFAAAKVNAYSGYWIFCQYGCPLMSSMNVYLMSLLGVNATANGILAPSESSAHPSIIVTPAGLEAAISQIAAELIWLAGQLDENNGGFALISINNDATELVLRWRLNINKIPVVCALTISFLLLAVMCIMIPGSSETACTSINGISVLEILWIGAHIHKIQNRLHEVQFPSLKALRAIGMFDVCLTGDAKGNSGSRLGENESRPVPLFQGTQISLTTLKSEDDTQDDLLVERQLHGRQQLGCKTKTSTQWQWYICQVDIPRVIANQHLWCYLLHGVLVTAHIALIAVFFKHTEHHIIIPLDSTGISTALKALLQIFYTLYTAVLVFMTQHLAVCQALASRHDLTSVHDTSCSWMGIGSAVIGLSQQRKIAVSLWMTLCIMVYFACISILHISSSAIMEFQTFDGTMTNLIQSPLAWPNSSVGLPDLNWTNIIPLVSVVEKIPNLSTKGLFSNTIYDTPSVTPESLYATVNATTINAQCGLVPNPPLLLNTTLNNVTTTSLSQPMWNNTIMFMDSETPMMAENCSFLECDSHLFFLVSTTMDVDATSLASGSSIGVEVNCLSDVPDVSSGSSPCNNSLMMVYLISCSLNATTVLDTLDLQNNLLTGLHPTNMSAPMQSQEWTLWSSGANISELNKGISTAMASAPPANCPFNSSSEFWITCSSLTNLDVYIMEEVGINATNSALTTASGTPPAVTLDRYQFENAVSQIAAQLIWLAGHMNAGFQPAYGTSEVTDTIVQLQLNINIIPLSFATGASVALFLLLFYLVGVTSPRSVAVSSLGVLETLWLESHSQRIHERMVEVDDPSLDNLRRVGMFKVCLADELGARKESDEQEGDFLTTLEDD
ncbi:hypothetical protein OG21DRAFT_151999 [Imleria badia]|nr:hypothetical protein OG21DRAFT_151999 [Imleria badia]